MAKQRQDEETKGSLTSRSEVEKLLLEVLTSDSDLAGAIYKMREAKPG